MMAHHPKEVWYAPHADEIFIMDPNFCIITYEDKDGNERTAWPFNPRLVKKLGGIKLGEL